MFTWKKFGASNFSTPLSSPWVARSVLPDKFKLPEQEVTFRTDAQIGKSGSAKVYSGSFGTVWVTVKIYNFDKPSLPVNGILLQMETARDKEMAKLMGEPADNAAPFFHPTRAHPKTLSLPPFVLR